MIARPSGPGSSRSCGSCRPSSAALIMIRRCRRRRTRGRSVILGAAHPGRPDDDDGHRRRPAGRLPAGPASVGIFKSARPNDMVQAGLGRTFQNIRLFPNMTALENVLVGMHTRLKATWVDAMLSTPRIGREEVRARDAPASYLEAGRARRARTTSSRRTCRTATSAAWRSRGRWLEPGPAPPRRADGRDEPARDAADDEPDRPAPRRPRPDRPADRARHAGRHGDQRSGHGPRPRREDRGGHAGRGPRRIPKVIEAYLGAPAE